jgi:transposase
LYSPHDTPESSANSLKSIARLPSARDRVMVLVMDNLAAHKGQRIKALIEKRGCELIYLPPHSPDLNPIEEAFS